MAKYVVRSKKDKSGNEEKTLYYGIPVSSGVIDLDYIAREVSVRSSLTEEDVIAAVSAVARLTSKHLSKGDSVNLKGFGMFTVSASSEGCATPEECTPAKVKPQRVCFKADSYMRGALAGIKYELREAKKSK
ncbi:HU family DNA-binding protein [Bacteroides sp. 51]|uniref:HU family DNA-binding protein n=1 Tax=Bacteroides sp. 51 TaxID=2302938 RepID=UPI0013D5549C|nr:HU family DNA-binding protein [Bacteroides sp. 51]NDV83715.1 hypothetical protein [Bacteroides sp. 51]